MDFIKIFKKKHPIRGWDLNKLIGKIEKYIDRPTKFSLREFKQLQSLRDDVLKLEEILDQPRKKLSVLIDHYQKHAWKLEQYSERIERKLNIWINRLEQLITDEEQDLTAPDRQYFESWKNKIDICKNNLIRILARGGELHNLIGELHNLTDKDYPDWNKVKAKMKEVKSKINEAFGDNWHPGIRTLVVSLKQLEKAEERLGKVEPQKKAQKQYQERLEQLKSWQFPVETEPQYADFLIRHWSDTSIMAENARGDRPYLFQDGLLYVKDLINKKPWVWPGLVEITIAQSVNSSQMFKWGLPAVKTMITKQTWPGMIEMAKAIKGHDAVSLFRFGLPAVKTMINEQTWPIMIKLVKEEGKEIHQLFRIYLPAIKDLIIAKPWVWPGLVEIIKMTNDVDMTPWYKSGLFEDGFPAVKVIVNEKPWTWEGMVEMAKAAGTSTGDLYQYGLPAVKNIINERTWPMIVEGFIDMTKAAKGSSKELFQYGLPAVKNIINERTWPMIVEGFVKMTKTPTWNGRYLFEYGLLSLKNIIDERTWPMIVEGFVEISKALNATTIVGFYFSFRTVKYIVRSEEDWQIIVKFVKSIASNRQKLSLFENIGHIPPNVLRTFSDFILIVMDKQPSHMVNILKHIRVLEAFKISISAEILQFARIVRTFRLNPREYPSKRIKQDIRNTYIFLAQQTMKKNIEKNLSGLDRDIEKLSNSNAEIRRATMDKISKIITPLIVEYLEHVSTNKFEQAWHEFTGIGINKDIEKKHFEDLLFALQIAIKNDRPEAKLFLEQISLGNFYPEKDIKDCYPYDQKESLAFIATMESKGVDMRPWLYGFEKILDVQSRSEAEHVAKLIKQRTDETLQLYRELGVQTTIQDMNEDFKKIKDNPNKTVVQDIKLHLQNIKSLAGSSSKIGGITQAKVYIELNPLKVLQMGEKVSGSCLSMGGGNARETITNAIDVNKRVVWAEHNGQILGRVLLAMNDDGEILRYLTYYTYTGIDLDNTFNAFVQELAKACHTKISVEGNVSLILASSWYPGSSPE